MRSANRWFFPPAVNGRVLALRLCMQLITAALRRISPVRRKLVLAAELDRIPEATSCAVFARLREHEIDEALALSNETDEERALMKSRFRRGSILIGGRVDGALAFYAWTMLGEMEIGPQVFPVPPAIAYSYKVFTAPAYRRRGIACAYYSFLRRERPAQKRVLASIDPTNRASLEAHRRCGFAPFGGTWELRGTERVMASQSIWQLVDAESYSHGVSWTELNA